MQLAKSQPSIQISEGRFARLEAIEWWDQALLSRSKVLVIGAGALGNEVIKNLALLGVGQIVIADMDRVELSNLSRSVLFEEEDEGLPKAECAARTARQIYKDLRIHPVVGNVLADLGLGYFRWADVVIGALDNREARVFVNSACARVGRPWFDGGIEVLQGVVRGFSPPATACYECTMSKVDWELLNKRRSCSLLARRAIAQRGTPTTPTTASVIAGIQVQEVVKHLHGMKALLGEGFFFEGAQHSSSKISYRIDPECAWHESPPAVESMPEWNSGTRLEQIWQTAGARLGGIDGLEFARELVEQVVCPACGHKENVWQPAEKVREDQLLCPRCGVECAPIIMHSISQPGPVLEKTVGEAGLPPWEIVWARRGTEILGLEIAGDNPFNSGTEKPKKES